MRTFDSIHVTPSVFPEESLVWEALVTEATGVAGIPRWLRLPVEVVLQLCVVGEEATTRWTSYDLLCRVNAYMFQELPTITA